MIIRIGSISVRHRTGGWHPDGYRYSFQSDWPGHANEIRHRYRQLRRLGLGAFEARGLIYDLLRVGHFADNIRETREASAA